MVVCYMDNRGNSRANTCRRSRLLGGTYLLDPKPARVVLGLPGTWVIHDNFSNRTAFAPAMVHSNFCPINFRWYGSGLPWLQRVTEN